MKMSAYSREVREQAIANCRRAIPDIEEQIKWLDESHNLAKSKLEARLRDCQETIAKITSELAE